MVNVPFVWAWKIGISKDAYKRALQNSRNVPGVYVTVAVVRIAYAYHLEQMILKGTAWAKTSVLGKGGREVRLFVVGIPAALFVWALIICKWLIYVILVGALLWYAAGKPEL